MSDPRFAQRETSLSQKSQSSFGSACELRTGKCTKNKTNMYRATSWAEEPLICLFSDLVELFAKITSESASQRCSGKKTSPTKLDESGGLLRSGEGRAKWHSATRRSDHRCDADSINHHEATALDWWLRSSLPIIASARDRNQTRGGTPGISQPSPARRPR